jgi:DNA-binding response OmpR family regulator
MGAMRSTHAQTILLVDDQDPVRTALAGLLRHAGYHILEAASGDAALPIFREHVGRIDVLLSDITMPGMQGPELAQRLITRQPDLSVLLISGFVTCAPSTFGLDDRHVAFLAKPFRVAELLAKLEDLLGRAPRPHPEAAHRDKPARTVLVVDDDETTVDHYARILRSEGFHVVTAMGAEDGYRAIAAGSVDAILLDVRMPHVDGLEFLQRLRREGTNPTPVAMLTGDYLLDERTVAQIHALGADLHFKPLWVDEVVAIVRTLLSGVRHLAPS